MGVVGSISEEIVKFPLGLLPFPGSSMIDALAILLPAFWAPSSDSCLEDETICGYVIIPGLALSLRLLLVLAVLCIS